MQTHQTDQPVLTICFKEGEVYFEWGPYSVPASKEGFFDQNLLHMLGLTAVNHTIRRSRILSLLVLLGIAQKENTHEIESTKLAQWGWHSASHRACEALRDIFKNESFVGFARRDDVDKTMYGVRLDPNKPIHVLPSVEEFLSPFDAATAWLYQHAKWIFEGKRSLKPMLRSLTAAELHRLDGSGSAPSLASPTEAQEQPGEKPPPAHVNGRGSMQSFQLDPRYWRRNRTPSQSQYEHVLPVLPEQAVSDAGAYGVPLLAASEWLREAHLNRRSAEGGVFYRVVSDINDAIRCVVRCPLPKQSPSTLDALSHDLADAIATFDKESELITAGSLITDEFIRSLHLAILAVASIELALLYRYNYQFAKEFETMRRLESRISDLEDDREYSEWAHARWNEVMVATCVYARQPELVPGLFSTQRWWTALETQMAGFEEVGLEPEEQTRFRVLEARILHDIASDNIDEATTLLEEAKQRFVAPDQRTQLWVFERFASLGREAPTAPDFDPKPNRFFSSLLDRMDARADLKSFNELLEDIEANPPSTGK